MARVTTAVGAAVAVSIALAGCTPTTDHASTVAATPPTIWTGSPAPAHSERAEHARSEGANLHQYIVDNKIAETPFKKDEPGTPKIDFPFPPGWSPAGDRTPDWAYGAIVYGNPTDLTTATFMYAIASKLTGNVSADKVLELAPGQLNELPEFKSIDGGPERVKFAGFDAVTYTGTYMWDGKPRAVGQETIVIPDKDELFVLQLNGEAPVGQEQAVIDAVKLIREQTKITLPS